jgi:hypothetical protein
MCPCLFPLLLAATSRSLADSEEGWKSFKGAWFSVEYPSGFQATLKEQNLSQKI